MAVFSINLPILAQRETLIRVKPKGNLNLNTPTQGIGQFNALAYRVDCGLHIYDCARL